MSEQLKPDRQIEELAHILHKQDTLSNIEWSKLHDMTKDYYLECAKEIMKAGFTRPPQNSGASENKGAWFELNAMAMTCFDKEGNDIFNTLKFIQLIIDSGFSRQRAVEPMDKLTFMNALAPYHGGNPSWWIDELENLWKHTFSKLAKQEVRAVSVDEMFEIAVKVNPLLASTSKFYMALEAIHAKLATPQAPNRNIATTEGVTTNDKKAQADKGKDGA